MGCEKPSQIAVWATEDGIEFYTCPVKVYKSSNLSEWYDEYLMLKSNLVAPDKYNEKQARWYDAVKIYQSYYNMFVAQINKQK
jgi:hypothetical protein